MATQTETIATMAQLWAKMYYSFAKELTDSLGDDQGSEILIKCIKNYAKLRGRAVADYVKSQHLEYNAANFVKNYDAPFAEIQKACLTQYPGKKMSPSDGTTFCPYKEIWESLPNGQELGLIYCEEFHKAMWGSYHPELRVRQDKIMTKGDEKCTFHTYMKNEENDPVLIFDQK